MAQGTRITTFMIPVHDTSVRCPWGSPTDGDDKNYDFLGRTSGERMLCSAMSSSDGPCWDNYRNTGLFVIQLNL